MTIASGKQAGDVLAYAGAGGIMGTYAFETGALTMTGSAPVATWETALRAVTYSSTSEDPTGTQAPSDRVVSFVISDGDASSVAVTRIVTTSPSNDVPVLAGVEAGALAYTENDAATCLLYTSPSPRDQRGARMPSSA